MGNVLPEGANIPFPDAVFSQFADYPQRGAGDAVLDKTGNAESACCLENLAGSLQVNVDQLTVKVVTAFAAVIYREKVRRDSAGGKGAQKFLNLGNCRQARFGPDRGNLTEFNFEAGIDFMQFSEKPGDNTDIFLQRVE